jgi:pimeloyl-ACP methyl ester carboxylesterase
MTMAQRTGSTLNFVERGEGTPVLALHGWWPDHRLMLGSLEGLFARRPEYRRLYPDLPGMGKSPAPQWITSSDDVLDAVQDFVDQTIGERPFLLVGESYGGYLARSLVRTRVDQVLGLALICPTGTVAKHSDRNLPDHQVLREDPDLFAGVDDRVVQTYSAVAVVRTQETLRRFREETMTGIDIADADALARIQQRFELSDSPEGPVPFPRPTLILTGRQDNIVGYLDHIPLLPHYPRATFAVLDIAGHNLKIEQPQLFDALMREWLDRVDANS